MKYASGATSRHIEMPKSDPKKLRDLWLPIVGFEAVRAHADNFPARADDYGDYFRSVLDLGLSMDVSDYQLATKAKNEFTSAFEAALDRVDAVICPAGGFVFEADGDAQYGNREAMKDSIKHFQGQFTIPANLAGTPAIVVPCGFSDDKRPYALQLLGSKLSEEKLCRLGQAYEQQFSWSSMHPKF